MDDCGEAHGSLDRGRRYGGLLQNLFVRVVVARTARDDRVTVGEIRRQAGERGDLRA
jgi:hypothetical protein